MAVGAHVESVLRTKALFALLTAPAAALPCTIAPKMSAALMVAVPFAANVLHSPTRTARDQENANARPTVPAGYVETIGVGGRAENARMWAPPVSMGCVRPAVLKGSFALPILSGWSQRSWRKGFRLRYSV